MKFLVLVAVVTTLVAEVRAHARAWRVWVGGVD